MNYNYISISKIHKIKKINKKIKLYGWIKNKRESKIGLIFLDINDGSDIESIQVIIKKKNFKNFDKIKKKIKNGCSVKIIGSTIINKNNKKNEILVSNIEIIGEINNPEKYPIGPKFHTIEYLREISHLRPRTKLISSISRIRNTLFINLHKFFQKKNFYWIPTPIITSLDTEGYSELFQIKKKYNNNFFNKKAFLTVSGQLNLETYSCSLSKVYNFGPVFRAENSNTNKHLSEFWMLETEIAFYNLKKIINLAKNMLSFCIKKILDINYNDILFLSKYNNKDIISNNIKYLIEKNFIEINYKEIIKILKKNQYKFKKKVKWGIDISSEHEKYLTEKYFKKPIIIKNFPKKIKAFYMKINKDKKTVSSVDFILPFIGEIIGGSEREFNIKKLDKSIKEKKLKKNKYWWYREIRKYGTIPHSGFGLGFERLMLYITNIKNIRDIIPFPRYKNYLEF